MKPDAEVIEQNRRYWDAIAADRLGEPVDFFRAGGSALTDDELALIGDPAGLRVLQLACSMGDEALTLARLGAQVTAVDFAAAHLQTGQAKAAALGVTIDFVRQDMMALAEELTGFDRVLISSGGLCWVPDLDRWAAQVLDRMAPGGRLVISEHHPLWEVLTVTAENALTITGDYFGQRRDGYSDPLKAPQVTWGSDVALPAHSSFVWSIGRVVTALAGAGLTINSLQEYAAADMYPDLGSAADSIPSAYLLCATRS